MARKKQDKEIPYFISIRGCINCDSYKSYKEESEKNPFSGALHEKMAKCLLLGCQSYGVILIKPFIDPSEVIKLAKEKGYTREKNSKELENVRKYILNIEDAFGKFYDKINVSLDDFLKDPIFQ